MNLHGIWIYINLLLQILFILFFFIPKPVIQLCQTTDQNPLLIIVKFIHDRCDHFFMKSRMMNKRLLSFVRKRYIYDTPVFFPAEANR